MMGMRVNLAMGVRKGNSFLISLTNQRGVDMAVGDTEKVVRLYYEVTNKSIKCHAQGALGYFDEANFGVL